MHNCCLQHFLRDHAVGLVIYSSEMRKIFRGIIYSFRPLLVFVVIYFAYIIVWAVLGNLISPISACTLTHPHTHTPAHAHNETDLLSGAAAG